MGQQSNDDSTTMDYKDLFSFFDKEGDNTIAWNDIGTIMRLLGLNPTESELQRLIDDAEVSPTDRLSWEKFLEIIQKTSASPSTPRGVTEAFQTWDPTNSGFIPVSELKTILTTSGELLTDQEMDALLSIAPIDDQGRVDYKNLISSWIRLDFTLDKNFIVDPREVVKLSPAKAKFPLKNQNKSNDITKRVSIGEVKQPQE